MSNKKTINVSTVIKINSYICNIIEELKAGDVELSMEDKIDIGALFDNIRKKTEAYVKPLKVELITKLSLSDKEYDGGIARARYAESANFEIPINALREEVTEKDFDKCISVVARKVKDILPEVVINKIKVPKDPTSKISFQLK